MRVSAIIYGADSGIIRRIVVSDALDELSAHAQCAAGEALLIVDPATVGLDQSGVPDLALAAQLVAEARDGASAETATCAVIDHDSGEIVAVIQADPTLDSVPDATLYQAPDAMIGGTLDENGDVLLPPSAVIDPNPAPASAQ